MPAPAPASRNDWVTDDENSCSDSDLSNHSASDDSDTDGDSSADESTSISHQRRQLSRSRTEVLAAARAAVGRLRNLQSISYDGNRSCLLLPGLHSLTSLTHLTLSDIRGRALSHLRSLPSSLQQLQIQPRSTWSSGAPDVLPLAHCTALTYVCLITDNTDDLELLSQLPSQVQQLDIEGEMLDDEDQVETWMDRSGLCLKQLTGLRSLKLNVSLTEADELPLGLQQLEAPDSPAAPLLRLKQLQRLELLDSKAAAGDLRELAAALKQLSYVGLGYNEDESGVVRAAAAGWSALPLQHLRLGPPLGKREWHKLLAYLYITCL